MHLLCPHCQNPIELADLASQKEIVCPSCGSSFQLERGASTTEWHPRRLGKFDLLEAVGVGAFGTVYKARDPELDRIVAIKVPRAGNLPGNDDLDRFLREARSVAQLRHPGIVPIHEVGQIDGVTYLVSDFVDGITLNDFLAMRRPAPREAAQLMAAVADALHYAHDHGVIHRDVKPSNIMLSGGPNTPSKQYTAHVMDFGLAKREAGEITMTMEGQVLGTPAYMSPEQARGEAHKVDARSDVYSLGVILYRMLTGELPFRGNARMILHQVLHDEPRSMRTMNDHLPRDLETVCLKAMAKEPSRRYSSALDLADDLRRFLNGEPIHARRVGQTERLARWCKRNPVVAALGAGVVAALLSGTAFSTYYAFDAHSEKNRADEKAALADEKATLADETATRAETDLYTARMNLAQTVWDHANVARILDLLEPYRHPQAGKRDLRGWEWYYQDRVCHAELRTLHTTAFRHVAFSPDGTRLASVSEDYTIKIWDAVSSQELRTLKGHTGPVSSVVFCGDSSRLASGSSDYTIKIWDAASGQELRTLKGHTDQVWGIAFSSKRNLLASGSRDNTVKIWDAASGQELRTLRGHSNGIFSVAFNADGSRLASAAHDRSTKIWDTATGQELRALPNEPGYSVVFAPDSNRLASTSFGGSISVWDADNGQRLLVFQAHRSPVTSVAFSPDGSRLASGGPDQAIRIWDATNGNMLLVLRGHSSGVESVAFSPDGARLASGSWDQTIKIWDVASGQEPRYFKAGDYEWDVLSLAFSPDGSRLASAIEHTVQIWDASSGLELRRFSEDSVSFRGVAFSPDGSRLVSGIALSSSFKKSARFPPGTIIIWDAITGRELRTFQGHSDDVQSVAFSPDGRQLASAGRDRTIKIWDAATGQELHTLKGHTDEVTSVAYSPDGNRLASGSRDQTIKIWDAASGQELSTLKGHIGHILCLAYSPEGGRLASAGDHIRIWDTVSGLETRTLKGHTSWVNSVAFSPDGNRLASASEDRSIKIWDTATGQELRAMWGVHADRVMSVAFNPDGWRLASGAWNRTIMLWDARPWTSDLRRQREALGFVQYLCQKTPSKQNVIERIQADKGINEDLRQDALSLLNDYWPNLIDDFAICNNMAWRLLTSPPPFRDAKEALALAERAVKLESSRQECKNTLGAALYRNDRLKDAAAMLEKSQKVGAGKADAFDLFFLAMCHAKLGNPAMAKDCLDRAVKWVGEQKNLDAQAVEDLKSIRAEAEEVLRAN